MTWISGAAIALGTVARILFVFRKPLWADEFFTLSVARLSLPKIVSALRVDSGPPLHYFVSHFLLLPFGGAPGSGDLVVRLLSLLASLLQIPLLIRIGRRMGAPDRGLLAAALFALFPLAADYAAEGRGYALASLLSLAALERALALREKPTPGRVLSLGFLAATAVLTHYLALFPVAALAYLAVKADARSRRALIGAGFLGAALASVWIPVALDQPLASMGWAVEARDNGSVSHLLVNLVFGIEPRDPRVVFVLALLGLVFIALVSRAALRRGAVELLGVLALALGLLALASLRLPALLLPERSALLFLPLVALLVSVAGARWSLGLGAVALAGLLVSMLVPRSPSGGERLARQLLPLARSDRTICVVGLWGPELRYRLAAAGAPGTIELFPSVIEEHPGWYREESLTDERLRAEARALMARSNRPELFILPRGHRASDALAAELARFRPVTVGTIEPLIEVLAVPTSALPRS